MAEAAEMKDISKKLKTLRNLKGKTLQDVSDATGISVAFLSLVENSKSGISLANLQKIMKYYGTSINDIINLDEEEERAREEEAAPATASRVVRFEEAKRIRSFKDDVKVLSLVHGAKGKKMWPGMFIMEPGATMGPFNHEGEEFGHIIQGKVEVILTNPQTGDTEKYILTEGDTIYYPSSFDHSYANLSRQKSILIATVTPPTF
ncbi:MAG: cupin domain-containing protein [Deltaproteobacteria bacterium]|nr:cupin domain-containing protein [Deltaproteobacteria bacterium]